jgi:hypothetical protein
MACLLLPLIHYLFTVSLGHRDYKKFSVLMEWGLVTGGDEASKPKN